MNTQYSQEPRRKRMPSLPAPVFAPRITQPYGKSTFTKPIINHLVSRDFKNLLFVGDEEFVSAGRELATSKFKVDLPESRLQFSVQPNSDILKYGCANAPQNGISLLRLSLKEETDPRTRILQADKLIGKAFSKLKNVNALVTVVLSGRRSDGDTDTLYANHGLFMMKILNPPYVPLTIEDLTEKCS